MTAEFKDRPLPPVPNDLDLSTARMMLDTRKLLKSKLYEGAPPDAFKAAVGLWCIAWQEIPASSLPRDEKKLAALLGIAPLRWKSIREWALRNWSLHADGRLYHHVVSAAALDALRFKEAQSKRAKKRWDRTGQLRLDSTSGNAGVLRDQSISYSPPSSLEDVFPPWVQKDSWAGFIEMRSRAKKPLTERAAKLILNELEKLRAAGHDPNECLDQSTRKNYLDVYAPKSASDTRGARGAGLEDRNRSAVDAALGRKPA